MQRYILSLVLPILFGLHQTISAQDVAVKTNGLYWLATTPNIGAEFALSNKWTAELTGAYNPWTFKDDKKLRFWLVQPEVRYWFCQRFTGHFVGLEAHGGQFNVGNIDLSINFLGTDFHKLKDGRYQGWQGGAGLTYGYAWILSKHWNFEAEIGAGYSYIRYDKYPCAKCGTRIARKRHHSYYGLTKAQLAVVYIF